MTETPSEKHGRGLSIRPGVRPLIGFAWLVFLLYYVLAHFDALREGVHGRSFLPAALVALMVASWFVRAVQEWALLASLHIGTTPTQALSQLAGKRLLGYAPVRVESSISAWPRDCCHLRQVRYGSRRLAALCIGAIVTGVLGLAGLFRSFEMPASVWVVLLVMFGQGVVFPVVLWRARRVPPRVQGRPAARVLRLFSVGLRRLLGNGRLAGMTCVLQAAIYLLAVGQMAVAFAVCGESVDVFSLLVLQSVAVFTTIPPVTHNGLGVREAAIALTAGWLGYGYDLGLLAAAVERVADLAVILVLGACGLVTRRRRGEQDPSQGE